LVLRLTLRRLGLSSEVCAVDTVDLAQGFEEALGGSGIRSIYEEMKDETGVRRARMNR
jgi:hypothetical protein